MKKVTVQERTLEEHRKYKGDKESGEDELTIITKCERDWRGKTAANRVQCHIVLSP